MQMTIGTLRMLYAAADVLCVLGDDEGEAFQTVYEYYCTVIDDLPF